MCVEPVVGDVDGDLGGEAVEGECVLHVVGDECAELLFFRAIEVEDEFVVDLDEEARAQVEALYVVVYAHHGYLYHVGGGALHGHVDGVAFGEGASGGVAGVDVGEVAPATEECACVAVRAGELFALLDEVGDGWVLGEVFVDERGGFLAGDGELL